MRAMRLTRLCHAIACLALFIFVLATPFNAYSEMSQMQEYEVKAAFLFAFAKLTEWPKPAFEVSANNFVMCVLGENPFGDTLDSLVGRNVGGQNVSIKIVSDTNGISACNLLFVSTSEKRRLPEIIAYVRSRPILTVSDISGFEKDGGIISFFLKANRVRFRINITAAEKARLKLSSHLLEVADIVTGKIE